MHIIRKNIPPPKKKNNILFAHYSSRSSNVSSNMNSVLLLNSVCTLRTVIGPLVVLIDVVAQATSPQTQGKL